MKISTTLFFITFLLLPCLTHLYFVPSCGTLSTTDPKQPSLHAAIIVESDTGSVGINNYAFLYHELHCALKERYSSVQIDGWRIDSRHKACAIIDTDDTTENILQSSSLVSAPPDHVRTLCDILEDAKSCAAQYKGKDKLQIITGLMLHDEIGECDVEKFFPTVDFHLTVFWIHGHRDPPSVHAKIVDYAILESLTDISPRSGWVLPDVSLEQLHFAQKAGDANPILDSLYLRLKRMSNDSKVPEPTRKSRRRFFLFDDTTEPTTTVDTVDGNATSTGCQMAAAANNKIKKRDTDRNSTASSSNLPCLNNEFILIASPDETLTAATIDDDGSSTSTTTASAPSSSTTNTDSSSTTTAIYSTSSTTTEFFNTTLKPNDTTIEATTEWNEADASFLEKFGNAFGDRHNGILYLLFIIFIVLIILCGIALLVCCLWPKYYHDEVHSRKPRSKKSEKPLLEPIALGGGTVQGTRKTTKSMSTESAENKNNKKNSASKDKMDLNANKMKSSDAALTTSKKPIKSILKKSPIQQQQQKNDESKKKLKLANSHEPSSALHSDPERSWIDQDKTAIDIPPPMSPAGITPAPSNISYAENANMKFNDKKDIEAPPPELQPNGNNPFQI